MAHSAQAGRLIICPTPLGNLGDITRRVQEALRVVDVVCAEDTRVTGKLLSALGIEKRLERLDEASIARRAESVVQRVMDGEIIAYCSDAGMPGVSDPGMRLVAAARAAGAPVEVLPGPTAVATAYVASGCANAQFYFGGFFPRKNAEQHALLDTLRVLDAALIFYESPNRLVAALRVIAETFPFREVTVCRELTKLHEEVLRGEAAYVCDVFAERAAQEGVRGEIVIVIDGPNEKEKSAAAANASEDARVRAIELVRMGARGKEIAKALVAEFGITRNEAYDIALEARGSVQAGECEEMRGSVRAGACEDERNAARADGCEETRNTARLDVSEDALIHD